MFAFFSIYVDIIPKRTENVNNINNKHKKSIQTQHGEPSREKKAREKREEKVRAKWGMRKCGWNKKKKADLPGGPKVKNDNTFQSGKFGAGKVFTFGGNDQGVDTGSEDRTLPTLTEAESGTLLMLSSDSFVGFNLEFGEEFKGVCKADFLCSGFEEIDGAVKGFVLPSVLVLVDKGLFEDCVVGVD